MQPTSLCFFLLLALSLSHTRCLSFLQDAVTAVTRPRFVPVWASVCVCVSCWWSVNAVRLFLISQNIDLDSVVVVFFLFFSHILNINLRPLFSCMCAVCFFFSLVICFFKISFPCLSHSIFLSIIFTYTISQFSVSWQLPEWIQNGTATYHTLILTVCNV